MTTIERLDSEIAAAKLRREIHEQQLAEQEDQEAEDARLKIMAEAPEWFREFAQPFERGDYSFQIRFDLPKFSLLGRISQMTFKRTVQWHWTRHTAWHHVNTLDEALVYGAEQGGRWVDVPPPF